ncbi:MAG: hypothetical protein ACK4UU_05010, partial [Fimbriimonadales bacterium]
MRVLLLFMLLSGLVALGAAQTDAPATPKPRETTLSFTQEGERWWWAEDEEGKPLNTPQKIGEASATLKLPDNAATLWVYDMQSGNLAQLKVAELK